MTSAFPLASLLSSSPPHAAFRLLSIPRSPLSLSGCCGGRFRPSSVNLRVFPLLGQGVQSMSWNEKRMKKQNGGFAVCYAVGLNVQWVSSVNYRAFTDLRSSFTRRKLLRPHLSRSLSGGLIVDVIRKSWRKVLMLAKATAVQKSSSCLYLLCRHLGEYGAWACFLALLVRLFFYIPGELELPFTVLLLLIVAPHQVIKLIGTQEGAIISVLIAVYLGYHHFSHTGLQRAFDQGSVVATIAVICITAASLFLVL